MVQVKVRAFKNGGLYVPVKKSDGFREGDMVEVTGGSIEKPMTRTEIEELIERKISEARRY
jgi:hypothetical protein